MIAGRCIRSNTKHYAMAWNDDEVAAEPADGLAMNRHAGFENPVAGSAAVSLALDERYAWAGHQWKYRNLPMPNRRKSSSARRRRQSALTERG